MYSFTAIIHRAYKIFRKGVATLDRGNIKLTLLAFNATSEHPPITIFVYLEKDNLGFSGDNRVGRVEYSYRFTRMISGTTKRTWPFWVVAKFVFSLK